MAYDSYDMNNITCSHVEPYDIWSISYHMDHMSRPIIYVETQSVLRSQLYPILDDKDSLYLKLDLVSEHTTPVYAWSMQHILCIIVCATDKSNRIFSKPGLTND